jgi:dipeptidyl aminopeptidase/acylaminoacyl peptidase
MKKFLFLFVYISFCAFPLIAHSAESPFIPGISTVPPLQLNSEPLFNVNSCFSGAFATYESWQSFLKDKKTGSREKTAETYAKEKKEFDRLQSLITCENFDYKVDDVVVRGFYIAPKLVKSGKHFPLIIFNRGGNGDYGASSFGFLLSELFPLAEQGFVVVGSQYRGFIKNIPNSGKDEFGGKDLNDVLALVNLAPYFPGTEVKKIGMMGVSRGAMMTWMAAKQLTQISSIAIISGPTDLLKDLKTRPEMENVYRARIPEYATKKEQALADRSAIMWANKIPKQTAILLVHGTEDEHVNIFNALDMDKKLTELKHPHKLVTYPGGDHSLSSFQSQLNAEVYAWFKTTLR